MKVNQIPQALPMDRERCVFMNSISAKATVVILNWNGLAYLEHCLSTVLAQTYPNFEVVLVDNGSTDGSAGWVADHFPQVRVIALTENLGFAAGNNQAIAQSDGEYVVTLNNDTWVEPQWLAELVRAAELDPQVGMCASKMLFARHPEMINSTGISMDRVGIAWDRQGGETDNREERAVIEVFGPCAGAALYRRTMLEQIGLFDIDFFAYLEDVDLAWRAQLCGWRCLYSPQARVYHVHSGTSGEGSIFKARLLGRNKVWTILKNYPLPQLLRYGILIAFYDLAAIGYSVLGRRDGIALAGRLQGLRQLPAIWRKRQVTQALMRQHNPRADHEWLDLLDTLTVPWRIPARYAHLNLVSPLHGSEWTGSKAE